MGDATGTAATYINSIGETFLWEDRGQSTNNYYRWNCVGNGTGVTDINFDSCVWTCPTSGSIDVSDANVDAFDVRSTVITGFDQGILAGGTTNIWTGNTFISCGNITTTGSDFTGGTFTGFTGIADDSQFFWNSTVDPDGKLDGCSFTKGTNATHAIEFPTGMTSKSITIRDVDFNSYGAGNAANDSTFNVLATTGTLTINIVGGSGNVSYKTAGATVVIVQNPVTSTVNVNAPDGTNLENASVLLYASDGTSDLPFDDSISITRVTTTATVTHTAHGMATNDYVIIKGAVQADYNGLKQITVTTANEYTFTVANSPTTPATGTIVGTGVLLYGLTSVGGVISKSRTFSIDQPVAGWVRKGTSGERLKHFPIAGIVDSANGVTFSVQMISDGSNIS
jgi:hypothetical protein